MQRAAVIFNPTKVDRTALEGVVDAAQQRAGWGASLWLETEADDPGAGMARRAVEERCDVVLAVGGDGTIRSVSEGLRGSSVPLALCPQGTGNLLARNLGLTLDNLDESVDAAFRGVARPVDLAVAELSRQGGGSDEHVFVVMAGVGLDAQIMSSTDEELKKKVGMLAYIKAGVEALRVNRRMRIRYRLDDDQPSQAKLHTVLVGNCGSIGGNVLLLPDAAVDDGALDIVAVRPQGLLGWPRLAWKVLVDNGLLRRFKSPEVRERSDNTRELNYQQCERVELRFSRPEEIELDGDHLGEVVAARIHVEPGALQVMMPEGWTAH